MLYCHRSKQVKATIKDHIQYLLHESHRRSGWWYSAVVEYVYSKNKALDSIPQTTNNNNIKKRKKERKENYRENS